jgi:hypothetical protein
MVALPQTFKTEDVKTTGSDNVHVPDGTYIGVILSGEMSKSPYGQGKPDDLVLKVAITKGPHQNTIIEHRLGILDDTPIKADNPTFTWSKAAYGTLGQIADAFGMDTTPADTSLICNKPIAFVTATTKGWDKKQTPHVHKPQWDRSRINSYQKVPDTGVSEAVAPVAQASAAPVAGAPEENPFANV